MTQLLEKALREVSKLPAPEQDALAAILLEELVSEQRWSKSFEKCTPPCRLSSSCRILRG